MTHPCSFRHCSIVYLEDICENEERYMLRSWKKNFFGLENVNGRDLFPFWIRETHRAINRIDSLLVYFRAA